MSQAPTNADIDDAVSEWHIGAGGDVQLPDFLGWSDAEYAAWVRDENAVPARALAEAAAQAIKARHAALRTHILTEEQQP